MNNGQLRGGRPGFLTLAVLSAIVCSGLGCGSEEKAKDPVAIVQTTMAHRTTISKTISADAVVFPLQQAVLTPKITSTIKTFLVQRGSRVRKGQLLAVLENADLSAAAEQSKGEFEQAEAGYATTTGASLPEQIQKAELDTAAAKSALDAQQQVYNSRKELFEQGGIPRRDFDSAQVSLMQARSQYEQAQKQLDDLHKIGREQALKSASGQLAAAKGKFLGAQAQLSYSEIKSPIDGVVTERPQYPGELAAANQPLLTVMDLSKLIAKAHIAQTEAVGLKAGDPAELQLPGSGESVKGRVSLVSPALDPGSTTIEVWVETNKPDSVLKPGMTVQVQIAAATAKDALAVPASAVFKNADGTSFVLVGGADEKAHLRTVETGLHGAGEVQILSGIKDGEAVITSGGYALPDNTSIKVAPTAPTEKDNASASESDNKGNDKTKPAEKAKD
jgi:multidrug efflux pump subunit AcrA (membrane-fusion protein)